MGKVVSLETSARARRAATSSQGRRAAARQRKPSKTALVLGGGGFTGGRLRDRRAARARPAVGQPLGDRLRRLRRHERRLVRRRDDRERRLARGDDARARPAGADAVPGDRARHAAVAQPARAGEQGGRRSRGGWRSSAGRSRATSARSRRSTSCSGSPRACRPGMYSGEGIEDYVRRVLDDDGRTDDFRELERELYITATDLDTCERVVFGIDGLRRRADLDRRARLDGAADGLRAGRVGDRELVDGGLISTTNLDLAVEAGARLVDRRQPARAVRQRGARARTRCTRASPTWASRRSATRRSS